MSVNYGDFRFEIIIDFQKCEYTLHNLLLIIHKVIIDNHLNILPRENIIKTLKLVSITRDVCIK